MAGFAGAIIRECRRVGFTNISFLPLPFSSKILDSYSKPRQCQSVALSSTQTKPLGFSAPLVITEDDNREYMATFPEIIRYLTDSAVNADIPGMIKRSAEVLEYNVPTNNRSSGHSIVASYKILKKPQNITPENRRLVNILGWCAEMLQASAIMMDDIETYSENRHGVPCWYRLPEVGMQATTDGSFLEYCIYYILRKQFTDHQCYVPIVELFHDISLKASMGQAMDLLSMKNGRPDLERFTMNRYKAIVKYKTSFHSLHLPVALAMYFAGIDDPQQHNQAENILLEMGEFFQIQNDFHNCFPDSSGAGEIGTDISKGKCSWLAVVALQSANSTQRKIMEEHYGRPEKHSVNAIRDLFKELDIPAAYEAYEELTLNIINTHISQVSKDLPQDLFSEVFKIFHSRNLGESQQAVAKRLHV